MRDDDGGCCRKVARERIVWWIIRSSVTSPTQKACEVTCNQKQRTTFVSRAASDSVIAVVGVQSANVVTEL